VLSFHASHQLEFEAERLDGAPSAGGAALRWADRVKSMAIATLDRRCLQKAERIVVHTQFVLGQVEALVPAARDRVRIIPAGLDLTRFAPGDPVAARQRFAIPQEGSLVVTVRRLVRRMGIDLLIRAAARLRDRGADFHIAIGGAGPERAALESLRDDLGLRGHVTFLGRVPEEKLPELLRAADVIVVPSRSMEGFGMSTVEGLACGKPVVTTDTGASPEIVGPIDASLLVPADAEVLGDRLESLLLDPARRRQLGMKGREYVSERFSWPTVVAALDELYGELRGSASSRAASR
jgi:glycosyltransferase involved in cell wall biosynthesis